MKTYNVGDMFVRRKTKVVYKITEVILFADNEYQYVIVNTKTGKEVIKDIWKMSLSAKDIDRNFKYDKNLSLIYG